MAFLFDTLLKEFGKRGLEQIEIPRHISDNLKHELRPYQQEAFKRFIAFSENSFEGKQSAPYHLAFNMATGSGKTLIMAGLILQLYRKGFRNFLFFVNSTNILQKTKENFINATNSKYLFADKITIDGKEISVKTVENFDETDDVNINIKFTTVQKLFMDMTSTKENAVSYEDFEEKRIALIADEAHHLNSDTKKKATEVEAFESWENVVMKIFNINTENILLEFTATIDYADAFINHKYQDKVLFRYDLKSFRKDGYSKDIFLFRSDKSQNERILQALVMNLYRSELAAKHGINLKPVMLLKSKTIKESATNKEAFHKLLEKLDSSQIKETAQTAGVDVLRKAFAYFEENGISYTDIVARLRQNFKPENILSVNEDKDAELNQIRLNTLEDDNNPIRAIFAVDKLNEGWDVLNLFDIVRLYSNKGITGKTTMQEAQLIGRGARLYPFALTKEQDKYRRKYDSDIDNDLRILEQLYYHSQNESRYISELTKALTASGIYDEPDKDVVQRELCLKPSFTKTKLFQNGKVFFNLLQKRDNKRVSGFTDYGVNQEVLQHRLTSNEQQINNIYGNSYKPDTNEGKQSILKDIYVRDFPINVLQFGLAKNPFFAFDNLLKYFPRLKSTTEMLSSTSFLGGFTIRFCGAEEDVKYIKNKEYLNAFTKLLSNIESLIKANTSEYEGSAFTYKDISKTFHDKKININKLDERAQSQSEYKNKINLSQCDWYAYNDNWGTPEEKEFVEMLYARLDSLREKVQNIYLIRNERELAIYDEQGRRFEPDFLLFCTKNKEKKVYYQLFIEPKGDGFMAHDKWKEDFLQKMRSQFKGELKPLDMETDKYIVTGLPFYNSKGEKLFAESLEKELE